MFGLLKAVLALAVWGALLSRTTARELAELSATYPKLGEDYKYEWVTQDLPPRRQWGSNYGYCGETSTAAALLKFGAYMSQWDVRAISVLRPEATQYCSQCWYSIGVNDQIASTKMRLTFDEFPSYAPTSTTKEYYLWLKKMTRAGNAVTMTVYMNHNQFYGSKDPEAGFHFYDHIVSVAKYSSNYDDDEYHGDDVITFSDNGLWSPEFNPPYFFSYTLDEFCGSE